ncbi:VWA domain-containing protein [Paenibacillus azoreducens]|uniref:VWA domain-containing protein n=1 Tax=Paenibacillus azoreducens TaxID=116718 RepID=A0A919YH29_9BACL|nr:VWA domain-containing protein [Paenibacillus azoreducens]GIO48262.1 VWA domain-containing protein [Paenibacillus azoreducens]
MGVQFNHPWLLLLLIPLAAFMFYAYKSDFRLSGTRKNIAVLLRSAVILLLVLAVSGMQSFTVLQQKKIVYVADRSASMPEAGQAEDWMLKSAASKKADDTVGVVSASLQGAYEQKLMNHLPANFKLNAAQKPEFTNLESGLMLAGNLLDGRSDSRIVLISDGKENVGSMLAAGRMLKNQGIAVDVLPSPSRQVKDAAVEEVNVPRKLYQAESFSIEVLVRSTFKGQGELRLYEDTREIGRETVDVAVGENRYAVKALAKTTGLHRYRAEIFMEGDQQSANNAGYAFTRVDGSPKVLIVEGKKGTSANIASALSSGLIQYEVMSSPALLPNEMAKYAAYDSIIFNNVSGDQVGERRMEMIEQAVKSYGVGFMMVGGEESFGMGGYFKTPLERALPVSMELEGKRQIPSLGLILVIDRSGSMEGDKMEMAKEAAIRTVELLRSKDTVGVLAFDSTNWWVVPPTKVGDKKQEIIGEIQSIQSDGGTDIYPAAAEAVEEMIKITAQRKHIILMTDGQSAGSDGYDSLLETMGSEKITMSTVAVGMDADANLLESLADGGKGRFYMADDEATIPAIFSREAAMISKSYIVDKPFVPALQDAGDWRRLFEGGVPQIYGYVATTPKPAAQTVLSSPEPDPLLARWQYGSGRTVAWTSDMMGKWSKDWVSWPAFSNVLTQMVKWTFPQFTASPYDVKTEVEGNKVHFQVNAVSGSGPEQLQAVVTGDQLKPSKVELVQEAPGSYSGEMTVEQPGSFLLSLEDGSGKSVAMPSGLVVPYSPEYRIETGNAGKELERLAEMTGGRVLSWDKPEQLFAAAPRPSRQLHDLGYELLVAALLLWVADVAVRRLALPWGRIGARLAAPFRGRPKAAGGAEPADAGLGRLAARKQRAAAFYGGGSAAPPAPAQPQARAGGKEAGAKRPASEASRPAAPKGMAPRGTQAARPPEAGPGKKAAAAGKPPQPDDRSASMDRLLAARKRNSR